MKAVRTVHRAARGFTLLSVLVAMLVLGIGLLTLARTVVSLTSGTTQNENVSSLASFSNAFWGVVQSDPTMLTASNFSGTFTASNVTSAPAALQPWLGQVTAAPVTSTTSTVGQAFGLPGATVVIATSGDAGSGNTCSSTTGCTVTLTLGWLPPGQTTPTMRYQSFYYQFGL